MKFFKVFLGLALFAIAGLVAEQTGNVLAGIASIPLLTYGFESFTGLSLLSGPLALYGALSPIKRPAQGEANPGGGRKLWLIGVDSIVGEWPKKGDIVDGEIINPPVLAASAVFIEVAVSDNSLKIDQNMKGSSGYQSWEQMIEVKIAGFNPVQVAAIEKLLNQEVVAIELSNDGQRIVVGTSINGQQFEITHTSGAKGGDRREWTLKSKQDGYMHGYLPLKDTIVIPGIS